MKYVLLLLALSACAPQPKLISQPKDLAKYEAINEKCRLGSAERMQAAAEKHRALGAVSNIGLIGALIGAIAGEATLNKNDDFNKNQNQMWHECVAAHGYKLVD
jgi:hypothetical protein